MNDVLISEQKIMDNVWKAQSAALLLGRYVCIYDSQGTLLYHIDVRCSYFSESVVVLTPIKKEYRCLLAYDAPSRYATHAKLFSSAGTLIKNITVGDKFDNCEVTIEPNIVGPEISVSIDKISFNRIWPKNEISKLS